MWINSDNHAPGLVSDDLGHRGRHADFETHQRGNHASVEPDRARPLTGRHTPEEPTPRGGRRFTSQPSQRPTRHYDLEATATGTHIQVGGSDINRPKSSPHTCRRVWVRVATRPQSARFEPLALLRSFRSLVPHVRLSVLLAGPGPSGGTGPSRRCQGCCPPSPPFQGSGCPQLQRARCDEHEAVSFHHRTVRKRLVALEVTNRGFIRPSGGEVATQQVRDPMRGVRGGGDTPLAGHETHNMVTFHQPLHPLVVHYQPTPAQLSAHAERTIGSSRLAPDRPDLVHQRGLIQLGPGWGRLVWA